MKPLGAFAPVASMELVLSTQSAFNKGTRAAESYQDLTPHSVERQQQMWLPLQH